MRNCPRTYNKIWDKCTIRNIKGIDENPKSVIHPAEDRPFIGNAITKGIIEEYFLGGGDLKPRESYLSKNMMKVLNFKIKIKKPRWQGKKFVYKRKKFKLTSDSPQFEKYGREMNTRLLREIYWNPRML